MGVWLRELTTLYEAFVDGRDSPLPELPIQYADFAAWQREWLSGEILEAQLEFWKKQLAGVSSVGVADRQTTPARAELQRRTRESGFVRRVDRGRESTQPAGRRDAVYDTARGLQGFAASLHGTVTTSRLVRPWPTAIAKPSRV